MVVKTLTLLLNDAVIGRLEKHGARDLRLIYDPIWLSKPGSRPISLSLPLSERPLTGHEVVNYFDNLLPDNFEIRSRIARRFNLGSTEPFELLSVIGRDCVGALQLTSETPSFEQKIQCETLSEKEVAEHLRGVSQPFAAAKSAHDWRISIAGAQEKSALLFWKNSWNRPIGTTPTTHIFKLPIGYQPHYQLDLRLSCENEWLCAQLLTRIFH